MRCYVVEKKGVALSIACRGAEGVAFLTSSIIWLVNAWNALCIPALG